MSKLCSEKELRKSLVKKKICLLTAFFLMICLPFSMAGTFADKAKERKQQRDEEKVAAEQAKTGVVTCSLTHQGLKRTYDVHVPPSYNGKTSVPLVMVFHGGGGNAKNTCKQSGMNEKADQEGFIVVYPQGTGKERLGKMQGSWNSGAIGGGEAYKKNIDDIGFINQMLDQLEAQYNIDKDRVYSTGISMGGMISYRLGCEASERIAAIAPVSTALVTEPCAPERPVPVLHFQGTDDRMIPYQGGKSDSTLPKKVVVGGVYPSTREVISFWTQKDRCPATSQVTYKKGDVTCETYGPCAGNSEVTLCTIQGGGHTWPGTKVEIKKSWLNKILGKTTQDISATDTMWEFFKRHPRSKTDTSSSI